MLTLPINPALERLGFTDFFQKQFVTLRASGKWTTETPERVIVEQRGEYKVLGAHGPRRCVLSGRLGRELGDEQRPCVGDFVLATWEPGSDLGRIEHAFERRSVFRRKAPGPTAKAQSIAANVDVGFVVTALTDEASDRHVAQRSLNPRRVERYLRAIQEAQARAVVVVGKADLHPRARERAEELASELGISDVVLVSAHTGLGLDELQNHLGPRTTGVLVGSSGVGKSSLTNQLLGREAQTVLELREGDARGRHTTTHRELFVLANGGLLIDTPGMRELGLFADETTDTDDAGFDDITALARKCRFRDCRHVSEPGCVIRDALESGELSAERLEHARKLERELKHQQSRHDGLTQRRERLRNRARSIASREVQRRKGGEEK